MKHLILGSGRLSSIKHPVVSRLKGKGMCGGSNAGHGAYVKKDFSESRSSEGAGLIKKKLTPLKFKM